MGLSAGTPPPDPATSRTQSGLVKRGRANGAAPVDAGPGPGTADAAPAAAPGLGPSGDLLSALRRHSTNLQGGPGMTGQPQYGRPPSAREPQAVPPGPESPPLPPTNRATSGVYDPTGRHDRVPGDDGRPGPPSRAEPAPRARCRGRTAPAAHAARGNGARWIDRTGAARRRSRLGSASHATRPRCADADHQPVVAPSHDR